MSLVRIVTDFYARVLASPSLAPYFDGVPMETLIKHQTAFINAIGGPVPAHFDEDLARVHSGLAVAESDFDELIRLLSETLEWHSFPVEDATSILANFERRRDLIVTA
ncbi:MAG TPA: group 1 truncated hemoglobin [Acidimicrobiia bacterium]|nr:group 1 truncated hemoglobin [Acidimicrobiia bacterium]